ncbi:MAG: TetR family transcriptional regulator C-terminal domain-containing protein [Pseudomonadota bacterium]
MTADKPKTRIQAKNQDAILKGALDVFAAEGFKGATLDAIAEAAGLSKPNLLYYFPSKEAIYLALIDTLLDAWLAPLSAIDPGGDPVEEILAYVLRKLDMSRTMPRESRLFANEILQGMPHISATIAGRLKVLVDDQAGLFERWIADGRLAPVEPHHLIFSIWATTQHYADFASQVEALVPGDETARFDGARDFLDAFYRRALTPS